MAVTSLSTIPACCSSSCCISKISLCPCSFSGGFLFGSWHPLQLHPMRPIELRRVELCGDDAGPRLDSNVVYFDKEGLMVFFGGQFEWQLILSPTRTGVPGRIFGLIEFQVILLLAVLRVISCYPCELGQLGQTRTTRNCKIKALGELCVCLKKRFP